MIKKLLTLFVGIIIYTTVLAQESKNYEKVKFGKVDPAEFGTKSFGKDTSAAAVVLFDIGYLTFRINTKGQWVYVLEKHKRLKILTKEGLNYGNFEISIYHGKNSEELLRNVQIASYNLIGGKVVQNKATKDEKFQDKYNQNFTNYKYTLSNVQEGTILETKYEIESDEIYTLRDWYFQRDIPTIWSEFTYSLPEYFFYKVIPQSFHPIVLESEKTTQSNFSGYVTGSSTLSGENYNFNCETKVTKYVSKNVPAFKNESYITTDDDYITKLSFEIHATNFPNSSYKTLSSTWPQIIEAYKKAERFGEYIKPNSISKKIIPTIIKSEDSEIDKAKKIFDYVKTNIKWNEKNGDYTSETSMKTILENKTGNIGDINLTLLNLLLYAELDAKPIILSTRNNGKHPGYPLSSKFNYVIVKLVCDSVSYLLDASNINNSFNIIGYNALNHIGFVIDLEKVSGEWIQLDPKVSSNTSIISNISFDSDLKITGNSIFRNSNYEALGLRKRYKNFTNEAEYLKDYISNKNGLRITKYTQSDFEKTDEPVTEVFEYELEDYIEQAGNLIYFNPLMYEKTKENPFKEEVRNFPVDFAYPRLENYRLILTIPEGYVIDKLPESLNFKLQDNTASFLYSCIQSGNKVLINSKIALNSTIYNPENYPDLKELFKQIVAKQNQPLVLKKI